VSTPKKPIDLPRTIAKLEAHWRGLIEIATQLQSAGHFAAGGALTQVCRNLDDITTELDDTINPPKDEEGDEP
jgi:hypothetical protein